MGQKSRLKKLYKIVKQVRRYGEKMAELTDEALSHMTVLFKKRLAEGESLDDILPEAFAAICEADYRILGMMPFDVQVLGGIALHQGCLAEMNTGEGKTLAATMPLYLNALSGRSTILLTANEYLVIRDAQEMGKVYRFMGLSVAAGVQAKDEQFTNEEKKKIYGADIVYTTHGALGFDYLFNNLVTTAKDRFMRELYYVVIDEADSVLLDAAQTPLVIAGSPRVRATLYQLADFFVSILEEGVDYEQEDGKVWLTDEGVWHAEIFFQIDNFYGRESFEINRYVTLALRAHVLFQKGKEYMITHDGKLSLLDGGSGRIMKGVKLHGGQHQAIEIKEGLKPSEENRSVASITYQNLFQLFEKMSGMSGTLADAAEELREIYGTEVLVIPPNLPIQRKDYPDLYFKDADSRIQSAIWMTMEEHDIGRPVLIVASTIQETEQISRILLDKKIPHNLLNANNIYWEADMIREAGQKGAVTVSTSIAGRGTDIRLGEGVQELGGLAVIGVGRMGSTRLERQARGRAGRQGDPGTSRFLVSIEDEVVKKNGPSNLKKYIEGKRHVGKRKLRRMVDKAQALSEEFSALGRKQALDYDQVLGRQRELMYTTRDRLLDGGRMQKERIVEMAKESIEDFLHTRPYIDSRILNRYVLDNISYSLDDELANLPGNDREAIEACLMRKVEEGLEQQEKRLGGNSPMSDFMRVATLQAIDSAWVEQVDYLQQLRSAVSGRASAQRNLLFEYQDEALESFHKMEKMIRCNAVRNILLSDVYVDGDHKLHIVFP